MMRGLLLMEWCLKKRTSGSGRRFVPRCASTDSVIVVLLSL